MTDIITYIFFAFSIVSFSFTAFGLFKFPDSYTRMHAAGIGDTFGVGFMVLGLLFISPTWTLRFKLLIVLILFWAINATVTHLLAKTASIVGIKPDEKTKKVEEEK